MRRSKTPAPFSRLAMLGLAGGIAGAMTLAAAELMPARSLGPIAGAPALSATPSRADLDYAHRAFEPFRDQADRVGTARTAALTAPQAGN